jgi:hypothetical protein
MFDLFLTAVQNSRRSSFSDANRGPGCVELALRFNRPFTLLCLDDLKLETRRTVIFK